MSSCKHGITFLQGGPKDIELFSLSTSESHAVRELGVLSLFLCDVACLLKMMNCNMSVNGRAKRGQCYLVDLWY